LAQGNTITISNGTDTLAMTGDGSFSMPTKLLDGSNFQLRLSETRPVAQVCNLSSGSGTIHAANAEHPSVECEANPLGIVKSTGAMASAREFHTATLLDNGFVLVKGGSAFINGAGISTSEIYNPSTGVWAMTGGSSASISPRYAHTATLLKSGKVLVAGGGDPSTILSSSELYDPATAVWENTGSLGTTRFAHSAILLPNGKVLVAGGRNISGVVIPTAELYNPALGTWSPTGTLATARYGHRASLLPNGRVLVTGGGDVSYSMLSSCEIYDPATETWSPAAPLSTGRIGHTATMLLNGKLLVAGGGASTSTFAVAASEIYDPKSGTWTQAGPLTIERKEHTATLLQSGYVLVSGGYGLTSALSSNELYDPVSRTWSLTTPVANPRYESTATLLRNGKVLITGGGDTGFIATATSELYW
jgi:hypothetical protein